MDGYIIALGIDIAFAAGIYLINRHYLSTLSLLDNNQSVNDFYRHNVETVSENSGNVIRDSGCNVIMSGELTSINDDKNKLFNDVVMWCQSILLNSSKVDNEKLTPLSYNVLCSPIVTLKRRLWKYHVFPVTESVVIKNPMELDGLESLYTVILDKMVNHNNDGYRVVDKMIFNGTPSTIRGWLTCNEAGEYFVSRNNQYNRGIFQISQKTANDLSNEVNSNKALVHTFAICFKVAVGLSFLIAAIIIYRKLKNRGK